MKLENINWQSHQFKKINMVNVSGLQSLAFGSAAAKAGLYPQMQPSKPRGQAGAAGDKVKLCPESLS